MGVPGIKFKFMLNLNLNLYLNLTLNIKFVHVGFPFLDADHHWITLT